jgi:dihydrofolate reductase
MRKLIYAINVTLDGCCDHTKTLPGKQGPASDIYEYFIQLFGENDLIVYGRKTYQLMVPYWPDVLKDPTETKADKDFARAFVAIDKLVFSRSLESAEDPRTRIARTDLHDEILKLKQQPGKKHSGRRRQHSFTTHRAWSCG